MDGSQIIEAPKVLPLGIHFGLPEDDYLSDSGQGSTQVKRILISPLDYWWKSPFGPEHVEETESSAQALGTALHKYILEGEEAFDASYIIAPGKADYPDLLVTATDLKSWLADHDEKVSGNKGELIERIHDIDPDVNIWDVICEDHARDCYDNGCYSIDAATAQDVRIRGKIMHSTPGIKEKLSGGYSEVSIFWEEGGVRYKARIDYLRTDMQCDLKSFSNQNGESVPRVVSRKVAGLRWHIQARLHWEGVQAAKKMILAHGPDAVFGDAPPNEWLIDFAKAPAGDFWWLFVQSKGAPVISARTCPRSVKRDHSDIWQDAGFQIEYARKLYLENMQMFGPGQAWIDTQPVHRSTDDDFPPWTIGG